MEKMEAILTCSICQETSIPLRVLPCSHTFCEKCLKNQVKHVVNDGKGVHGCPLCPQFCGEDKNFDIEILKELYQGPSSGDNTCDICKINKGEMKCTDCQLNPICEKCLPMHVKVKNSRGHNIITCDDSPDFIGGEPVYCKKHTKEIKDFYCSLCKTLVCWKCSQTTHKQHVTVTIEDELEQCIPLVLNEVGKIEQDILLLEKEIKYFEQEGQELETLYQSVDVSYSSKSENEISKLESEKQNKIEEYKKQHTLDLKKLEERQADHLKNLEEQEADTVRELEREFNKKMQDLKRKFEGDKKKISEKCEDDKKKVTEICEEQTLNLQTKYDESIRDRKLGTVEIVRKLNVSSFSCKERIQSTLNRIKKEYQRKAAIIDLAKVTLDNTKGGSLIQALVNNLRNQVKTESLKKHKDMMVDVQVPCETNEGDSVMYVTVVKGVTMNVRSIQGSALDVITKATNKQELIRFPNTRGPGTIGNNDRKIPERLFMVQHSFWIPHDGCIKVYSLGGDLQKFIKLTDIQLTSYLNLRLQQVTSTDVFLACERGLFVLDTNGQLQYKLEDGCFSDVTTNGTVVVAAKTRSSDTGTVHLYVFVHDGQKWYFKGKKGILLSSYSVQKIKLLYINEEHSAFDSYNAAKTLSVSVSGCNVTVLIDHCDNIDYVYTNKDHLSGKLCGIDQHHNLIVIRGDEIHLHREDNKLYRKLKFEGITKIQDVIVLGDKVYVLWESTNQFFDAQLSMFHS